ncbi:MAG: class I SAM-dependent RNA methyltransferase [Oscillospiraceae bacterium]|jgi:putative N6-adenine-specific DNA methylase|nr:class I SAM-dependent RNA methyltransferase [Oscillospiraceae bacterium]
MERFTMAVPCLFGLEGLVGDELRRMKLEAVRVEDRRVFFEGDFADMARANIRLRMGERVMLLLGRFPVHSFEDLYQGVKAIPLERFVPKNGAFPVKGYSLNSQLHSVPDCQSIAKKAAVDRMAAHYGISWLPETGETYQLRFSIMKDICEVFLDTSGASLHKRGYRAEGNEAPLHETMAAAMVNISRYRGREVFWDPFCGSGTIVIEAALAARNRAPGLNRSFSAQNWACVPKDIWANAKQEARDLEYHGDYRIVGTDIDSKSLAIAISNAKKAGVDKDIQFYEADATGASLPAASGVLVCNPPYGERMLEQRGAQQLMRGFGQHLRGATDWKKYIISSEPEFEHYFGKQAVKKRKLYNGRLQCNIYMYF